MQKVGRVTGNLAISYLRHIGHAACKPDFKFFDTIKYIVFTQIVILPKMSQFLKDWCI